MSSAMGPSSQALDNLGSAIGNLGLTIAGKLDDAERASQYNNGQEILRRNMNDFMLKLQSDPNTDGYNEKLSKAESDWWGQIDKTVKHQGAKNDLQAWYMSQRDSVEQSVGQQAINVRGNKALGLREQTLNSVMNDTSLTPAQQKQKYDEVTKPLVDSLLIDPAQAEIQRLSFYQQSDLMGAANGAFKAMQPTEPGGQFNFVAGHEFLADPRHTVGLTPEQVAMLDGKITTQEKANDYHNTQVNSKMETDLTNAETDILVNNGSLSKLQEAINKAQFVGTTQQQATLKLKWAKEYDALVDELSRKQKNVLYNIPGDEDNGVLNDFLYRATDPKAPNTESFFNAIVDQARQAYHDHKITDTQLGKVITAAKPRTDNRMARYDMLFTAPAGSADNVKNAFVGSKVELMNWMNNHPQATNDEIDKEATLLHDSAVKGVVTKAASDFSAATALYAGVPLLPAQPSPRPFETPTTPKAPTYPQQLMDKLKASKATVTGTQTSGGTTYYRGSDEKTYQVSKSGAILWWDGKTWQILK